VKTLQNAIAGALQKAYCS